MSHAVNTHVVWLINLSNDQNPEFFGGRQLEAAYHSNMTKQFVIRSTPCDHVRVLAIHRPEKRNALSQQVIDCFLEELRDAFMTRVAGSLSSPAPRPSNSDRAAGADIQEIAALSTEAAIRHRYLEDLCKGMADVKKPLLAAVEGIAVGHFVELN
ncbi:hypothetical protein NEMBOFW57_006389 [Staphylotrichum longicolle]|uniref:Uncharacterized protein n=1 Tax=Staphylotrichum longicolle TaxID=669026 RepID=A0AAD4HY06_9PEZI|nr:hypothetical protein NEMBOFW57_006389 [Staphylotrichum longicolle]